MAFAYVVKNQEGVHFVTFTVHQWVDVFTRRVYADELVNNLGIVTVHRTCDSASELQIPKIGNV